MEELKQLVIQLTNINHIKTRRQDRVGAVKSSMQNVFEAKITHASEEATLYEHIATPLA